MPPSGVDYASEFLNGYAPEYVHSSHKCLLIIFMAYRSMIGLEKSREYPSVDISVNMVDQTCCIASVV